MEATSCRRPRASRDSRLVDLCGAACARVGGPYRGCVPMGRLSRMQSARLSTVARIAAERPTAAGLDDAFRWLVQHQGTAMRLDVEEVPALGQHSWLRLALPITAP